MPKLSLTKPKSWMNHPKDLPGLRLRQRQFGHVKSWMNHPKDLRKCPTSQLSKSLPIAQKKIKTNNPLESARLSQIVLCKPWECFTMDGYRALTFPSEIKNPIQLLFKSSAAHSRIS